MRKSFVLLGIFLLGTLSATAQAQNYYVCDNGNDSNDGRTEAKPFKSYEKAMDTFNKMNAGGSVLFCRGGKFIATQKKRLANFNCSADKVCTIGDYGNSNLERPLIIDRVETGFNFQNGSDSRPDGGYHVKNVMLVAQTDGKGYGISFYNDVNDILIENVHVEGYRVGVSSRGGNKAAPGSGSNRQTDRLILRNSTIINNKSQGFQGGCNDCVIENNHFENNGFGRRILDHNIYISSASKDESISVKNILIRNNTLYRSTIINGKCEGVSLVVHGIVRNLTIENNTIKEDLGKVTQYCWGIGIDPGNEMDESFVGLKIHKNTLLNVGNIGIGCSSCKDAVISDNMIIDEGDVLRTGIAIPSKPEDSLKSQNITISGNKIALNHDRSTGINVKDVYPVKILNNDISILKTGVNTQCIGLEGINTSLNISSNQCKTHNDVSVIDQTLPETEVVENTPEVPVEEPVVTEPEPETEVVENTPEVPVEEPVVTEPEPETEVVENTPEAPVEEQPVVTEPETEVVENTPEVPVEQPVVNEPETVVSFERPSWASPRPTSSSNNFTVDNLIESMQNDYSNVSESECRVFARGKCLIR
ncbi:MULTISPECIES: hypothetical protein [unclassified Methylophaga]|uniref:hypothetical protein n=1 Tax=unclassified Methylophaga TaxID=2629249 RepID=UPI000C8A9654|nr:MULTISPECIES: hypothetical protein [unclassified Methylophaga]MBN47232.1 hypothetical protein [Methylophaga sp.]|tara:strand:- start:25472 stop:27241 length:1770 start_codon:yes stop_codon:yes gene_type:complete